MTKELELDVQSSTPWTDTPRALTDEESAALRGLSKLEAIKLYREMTRATLKAAVAFVERTTQ